MDLDRFVPMRSRSAASRVMSWSVEGIKEIRVDVSCRPTTEGRPGVCGRDDPVDFNRAQLALRSCDFVMAHPAEARRPQANDPRPVRLNREEGRGWGVRGRELGPLVPPPKA